VVWLDWNGTLNVESCDFIAILIIVKVVTFVLIWFKCCTICWYWLSTSWVKLWFLYPDYICFHFTMLIATY
jgi:hypothetical protein